MDGDLHPVMEPGSLRRYEICDIVSLWTVKNEHISKCKDNQAVLSARKDSQL